MNPSKRTDVVGGGGTGAAPGGNGGGGKGLGGGGLGEGGGEDQGGGGGAVGNMVGEAQMTKPWREVTWSDWNVIVCPALINTLLGPTSPEYLRVPIWT